MSQKPAAPGCNWEAWALVALLLVHIALGVYWSVSVPIWEGHDEDGHYYFVRFLATERRLPVAGERSASQNDEMHQPPLYYVLAALPVALVDVRDNLTLEYNPYMPWPEAQGGYNRFLHDPTAEAWPYRGTALAVHVARWVSVLLGAVGLLFTFLTARVLFPDEPWVRWGAVLVHALWPQYRFSTSVINNDIMAAVCVGAVTWLLVRVVVRDEVRLWDLLGLGAATGLMLLSKWSTVALLPVIAVVVVVRVITAGRAARRRLAAGLGGALLAGSLVAGLWCAYNLRSGAGLLGRGRDAAWAKAMAERLVTNVTRIPSATTWTTLREGLLTFWFGLGWNNIRLPMSLYSVALVWAALGLAGLALWARRHPSRKQSAGVAVLSLVVAGLLGFWVVFYASGGKTDLQGRYLLGVLSALGVLLAAGWNALLPRRLRPVAWAGMTGALVVLAVLAPSQYIQPAYAEPPRLTEEQAASYTALHVTFGDFAELVGYEIANPFVAAGDKLDITLVWRVLAQSDVDYTLAVQAFEPERELLGEVQRFPGGGAYATSSWSPGLLFSEDVAIPVKAEGGQGRAGWLEVSFFDRHGVRPVPAYDGAGTRLGNSVRIGPIKIRGDAALGQAGGEKLRFGSMIGLRGVQAALASGGGPQLAVSFDWLCMAQPDADYTVSLQLRNAQDGIAAQDDSQPRDATYPTLLWEAGEAVTDLHALALPVDLAAGEYTLYACLYNLADGQRLPVAESDGAALANSEVPLLTLTVRPGQAPELQAAHAVVSLER